MRGGRVHNSSNIGGHDHAGDCSGRLPIADLESFWGSSRPRLLGGLTVATAGESNTVSGDIRMSSFKDIEARIAAAVRPVVGASIVQWIALLALCAAYLQGGFNKATDFAGAIAEMNHFGLKPAVPFAIVTIILELAASVLILTGIYRWLGALALAGFTLAATFLANRFWEIAPPERFMMANSFFEHLGLVGGFLLVAWHDLNSRS